MFSKPKPNLIVSTKGFSVQQTGRHELLYIDGDQTWSIEVEGGFDRDKQHVLCIYLKSSLDKLHVRVDEPRLEEIVCNIRDALLFDGTFPEFS